MIVYFNGEFVVSETIGIPITNRSFRYGDGLFESIFVSDKSLLHLNLHLNRLFAGMKLLRIEIPQAWHNEFFTKIISELTDKNNFTNARCRLTVWRSGEGYYKPETDSPGILIELTSCENEYYELNEKGINLGVFNELTKLNSALSALKSANALTSVVASIFADENKFDDVVILNQNGNIAECISSNIFIYRDRQLFTPTLTEGCVDGIMRRVAIELCRKEGIPIHETVLTTNDLLSAEEIFLTNAISGIKWVGKFQYKTYGHLFSTDLLCVINEQKDNDIIVSG